MALKPGDVLFEVIRPGASRERLADFSAGTEDPNPIHVDEAFARDCGFKTVLQQGPMTTAHFAAALSERAAALKSLDVTFMAPVYPEEALRLVATVERADADVVCALAAYKDDGTQTARGTAVIAP